MSTDRQALHDVTGCSRVWPHDGPCAPSNAWVDERPVPPKVVELVGQRFDVVLAPRWSEALNAHRSDPIGIGTSQIDAQRITIADNVGPDQIRDTLLHEILHCLGGTIGLFDDGKVEERVIAALSPLVLDALRRNPELVRFLVAP